MSNADLIARLRAEHGSHFDAVGDMLFDAARALEVADAPPVYLALDVWQALDLPIGQFEPYYGRNGWADTWPNLLAEVRRRSGRKTCPIVVDGSPCVLIDKHIGPHMDASDVGSSEPLPTSHADGGQGA